MPSFKRTEWNYGFKVWIAALLGPFFFNVIRYFVANNHIVQYQLVFNAITLLLAIPLSVFPLLLFNYTVKKVHGYSINTIYKKLLLNLSYLVCLTLSASIPTAVLSWGNIDTFVDIVLMGLGLNIIFGLVAIWVFKIRID